MAIRNKAKKSDPVTDKLRAGIEHRAAWMYLLMDEGKKRGLKWKDFARAAILRCGRFHGKTKFNSEKDLQKFGKAFANPDVVKIFEMDVQEANKDRLYIEFHYCPLVTSWKKLGASDKECETLCDIAMDGDRGIVEACPSFQFHLGDTIAKGGKCCEVTIARKDAVKTAKPAVKKLAKPAAKKAAKSATKAVKKVAKPAAKKIAKPVAKKTVKKPAKRK